MSDRALIIPCSGIGKPFGSSSREATYCVVEELKKSETDTLCLLRARIDGCPNECSNVRAVKLLGKKGKVRVICPRGAGCKSHPPQICMRRLIFGGFITT